MNTLRMFAFFAAVLITACLFRAAAYGRASALRSGAAVTRIR